jgi:hypothetical protein
MSIRILVLLQPIRLVPVLYPRQSAADALLSVSLMILDREDSAGLRISLPAASEVAIDRQFRRSRIIGISTTLMLDAER